jgi:hypothetical protein
MTDARTKQVQEIEGLLAERRKYEQWLAQLEARKESTPSHVYVKVHRDYAARLEEAQQKLSSETGAVHALATELEDSLKRQEKQIAERTDERAEAELRAAVGEFAGKEWDKLRGKLDSAIAELAGERDSIQRELETLRALLNEAEPTAENGETKKDVDDIAFLRSVLGRATPYASGAAPAITEQSPAPAPAPAPAPVPAPVPRPSGVEKRPSVQTRAPIQEAATAPSSAPVEHAAPAPTAAPAPAPAPRQAAAPRASSAGMAAPAPEVAPPSVRQSMPELFAEPEMPEAPRGTDDERPSRPSGTFGQATPRTSEAIKSLKCQECGTLNFPTEWYCERCGGELAAF